MQLAYLNCAWRKRMIPSGVALLAGLGLLAPGQALRAQLVSAQVVYNETNVTVMTLGGGPISLCGSLTGDSDGNTLMDSQFDGPVATALNSQGTLYIADRTNRVIRAVSLAGNTGASQTTTLVSGFLSAKTNTLVGLATDAGDSLYILVQGANTLLKFNSFFNLLFAYPLPSAPGALAVSLDTKTNIFIALTNGTILQLTQNGSSIIGSSTLVASGAIKWKPSGIAWRPDGTLAVSDLIKNSIYTLSPTNAYAAVRLTGSPAGSPGWEDGTPVYAMFNQPAGLVWSADNQLLVADRGNNAVRRIDAIGNASTVYGVTNTLWGGTDCNEGIYAGWVDGGAGPSGTNATGRAPASVLIAPSGEIFVTELGYSLLREISNVGLLPVVATNVLSTNGTTNGSVTVLPPVISPNSGYYPNCQTITVASSVPFVYYSINGTAPTTNTGILVSNMTNNLAQGEYEGSFQWCNSTLDLSSLQLIASNGTNVSTVVTGQKSPSNVIGFPQAKVAGIGSMAFVPLVINLASNQNLASLQFRVEINPTTPATPPVTSVTLLPIGSNDFVPLSGPSAGNAPVNYDTYNYTTTSNNGSGILVTSSGVNSGFGVQSFAAAAVLEFQIPPTATAGQTYALSILDPSGTSDGSQASVTITPMADQVLTVSDVQYFVGDSSPSSGYSAGEFGNGSLDNADVNNALYASVGIRVPFPGSDAFNSMDVYPEINGSPGKGFITFLDAQIILFRSVGLDTNDFVRFWQPGGVLDDEPVSWTPGGTPIAVGAAPAKLSTAVETSLPKPAPAPPGQVWLRQAAIGGGNVSGLLPGTEASIPVYVKVLPGCSLAGMEFRAVLQPNGGAPLAEPITFTAGEGIPTPAIYNGLASNETVCVWSMLDPFTPALTGSNLLGTISFAVPQNAILGQSYTLRFLAVGGAPDLNTLYTLESIPGKAWIGPAQAPPQITSDEWRTNFFGSLTNVLCDDMADPDGDGQANWQEYLAGTNPTNALSNLSLSGASAVPGHPGAVNLSWLTAPNRHYVLQTATALGGPGWTSVNTNLGDGNPCQITLTNVSGNAVFYRIQLQP